MVAYRQIVRTRSKEGFDSMMQYNGLNRALKQVECNKGDVHIMKLIPKVKRLDIHEGYLKNKVICFDQKKLDNRLVSALKKLPINSSGTRLDIIISGDLGEQYELYVCEERIDILATGIAGAFYAIQTLRQLFKEDHVPCLYIKDWPDFSYRGFYHDVTRGRIQTVETIKKLIDDMAYYKMNSLQLYVEHVFEFEETKDLLASRGYLTKAEIREIDDYCRENFIDFIPSLSTFGHLYDLLEQPKYKHLQVLKNYETIPNFWYARMQHHTIDPLNPESFEIVKSLINQYAPHFTSEYFNICCDETFDLKRYAEEGLDEGKIYVDFVKKIIAHVQQKDKRVMMWADILLEHPDTIAELPEDILFLNWYYKDNTEKIEEKISKFAQSGKKQIVCPGTNSWLRLCENIKVAEINITKMIEIGHKYGAVGVLNTNWGDWGNPCSLELGMYGMVLGAEKSWSVQTELDDEFYKAVNDLLYGSEDGIQSLQAVSDLHNHIGWKQFCQNYFSQRYENGVGMEFISEDEVKLIQKMYQTIAEKLSGEQWGNDEYRKELLIATEGICVMAELSAKLAGYEVAYITDAHEWLKRYCDSWMKKNKPSELYRIEEMFEYYHQ